MPTERGQPADLLLGQGDRAGQRPNRDLEDPRADTMHWPFQVLTYEGRLYETNMRADRLTGQAHFGEKGDNRNRLPVRDSLCWPYGLQVVEDTAVVADTCNHRVALWRLAR